MAGTSPPMTPIVWCARGHNLSTVMPRFMPGIHVLAALPRSKTELALKLHARDRLEIAVPDFFLVGFRHVDAFDDAERFARVHRALFRIERAIRREHDLVEIVEGKPRMRCRLAAEHGGVGIECVLEVIERTLLQLFQDEA